MWSAALDAILTTLRYLAPATLLTLFWGQQSFLFKLLKHIDSALRAIVFSSEEQKQEVLQWLAEVGPVRVEHLDTVWRHGWIVCGVLDAALPGACAGHPPTRLSLKHAQAIADHYLGVEPVFSRQELDSSDSLSKHQEWKLATYLDRIRQSLAKLTPPVSKPSSQRTSPETTQYTLDYVAKGSGLTAAQVNTKMHFKIYPTSQQSLDPGEITILIRGPKDTYGMAVLPPILGKAQLIRQKLLGLQSKPNYTENVLPTTQGATYLRSYGKNNMSKTYYIPKTKYDIDVDDEQNSDHTKISYKVYIEGKYEISITSRGQSIVGSPYMVSASKNIISLLQKDSFYLEDGEEIDIVDIKTDRKVVLRIVDFVTEKMLLKENGTLEKITEAEAKILMKTDSTEDENYTGTNTKTEVITKTAIKEKTDRFINAATKVIVINRVCKVFNDLISIKGVKTLNTERKHVRPRSQPDIPDIVNSTLIESNHNTFILSDKREKYIVPENISVSLRTEKSCEKEIIRKDILLMDTTTQVHHVDNNCSAQFSKENRSTSFDKEDEDILMVITSTPSNPFLNDNYGNNFATEKDLGSYVTTEYETNNSQNEETPETPIKILIDENITPPPDQCKNPFIDCDIAVLERPKTPILKIITGEVKDREDSVYVNPKIEKINEEMLTNEFINPFFVHQQLQSSHSEESPQITDFIIGAPVSLPPLIRSSTPEPNMESLIVTTGNKNKSTNVTKGDIEYMRYKDTSLERTDEGAKSVFSTPLHTHLNPTTSSTFHSLDSNSIENVEIISMPEHQLEPFQVVTSDSDVTSKKEIWDSAYVSIDENNSSPDSNNNDNTQVVDSFNKHKLSLSDGTFGIKYEEITNMGPAERELWQSCNELNDSFKVSEEIKPRWESKRPFFTPIIEESDRSISSGMKDITKYEAPKPEESDAITVAFAELNDMYHDFYPRSETDSTATISEDNKLQSLEIKITIENEHVNSASENAADVKRHINELEGKISEVQADVTESVSVSQTLHDLDIEYTDDSTDSKNGVIQFGDKNRTNIVLERKKYWDDRIRQIEAKSQEATTLQKKRRLSSKHLRHNDSLTKRRGKHIVKNFLSAGIDQNATNTTPESKAEDIIKRQSPISPALNEEIRSNEKLVNKWKKYWDEKLESEIVEKEVTCFRIKSPKNKTDQSQQRLQHSMIDINTDDDFICDVKARSSSLPVKQELPEEVFKAFETSPKRFFGTSRKQILNKIDTFLGKPSTVDDSSADAIGASPDSGLVSSRISLFHSISHTEEKPWINRKCKSLHNIFQRKNSEHGLNSLDVDVKDTKDTVENSAPLDTQTAFIKSIEHDINETEQTTLKKKRCRIMSGAFNKTFDETVYQKKENNYVQQTVKDFSKHSQHISKYKKTNDLRRKSFSKSEMDIFNKATNKDPDDGLDKYKSCDELPKINVKSFISLYESVSKTSVESKPVGKISKTGPQRLWQANTSHSSAVRKSEATVPPTTSEALEDSNTTSPSLSSRRNWTNKSYESISSAGTDTKTNTDSLEIEMVQSPDKESTFLSLSDIELEIVESSPEKSSDSTPKKEPEIVQRDYKSRFKMAKEYFQSLEELPVPMIPRKPNECELLLQKTNSCDTTESLETDRPQKRVKKKIKAHSMPSSEIAKIWNQLQDSQDGESASKLVKISEKFNVDDLFTDVMEGKLSRQGSLRGIPHKKAVLEAFRSMENLTDNKMSPYEIAVSQLNDFAKENQVKNAQTYLTEYPYLPTTDPSKYHSRLDAKASGLISLKELKDKKPRRNSVPELRLKTFTVNL